jgi:hypothetical protein
MDTAGTDVTCCSWHHLRGEERRRYLWHWNTMCVAELADELIEELQERGVLLEVVLANHEAFLQQTQSATPSS